MDGPLLCSIHGTPMVAFCLRCRGKAGGSRRSQRKTKAVRKNAQQPRPRKKP